MKGSNLLGLSMCVALAGLALPLRTAQAVLSPLGSAGETIVFSDDFNNNNNGWANVGPGNTQVTIGTDPGGTGATVWYPTVDNGGWTVSNVTLPTPLNIKNGQIDVYMRVRLDTPNTGGNGNKYDITFGQVGTQDNTPPFARYWHVPGASPAGYTTITYNTDGTINHDAGVNFGAVTAPNASTFLDFRMQMDYLSGTKMNVTISYYNNGSYTVLGQLGPGSQADIGANGLFNRIWLTSSNRMVNGRAYYDSVVVSQVPEPATLGLMSLSLLGLPRRNRRRA